MFVQRLSFQIGTKIMCLAHWHGIPSSFKQNLRNRSSEFKGKWKCSKVKEELSFLKGAVFCLSITVKRAASAVHTPRFIRAHVNEADVLCPHESPKSTIQVLNSETLTGSKTQYGHSRLINPKQISLCLPLRLLVLLIEEPDDMGDMISLSLLQKQRLL